MNSTSLSAGYCQIAFLRAVRCRLQALFLGLCLVVSTGAVAAPKFLGGVELQAEAGDSAAPVVAAEVVYVEDFTLSVVEEAAPTGPLARLAQRLPRPSAAADAQAQARETVERMSVELVKSLSQQGFVAQRLVNNGKLPGAGWLIRGVFVSVDEGSRAKRAAIGFTSGASSMSVQASVSDLADREPVQPFLVLGAEKSPSKMPGAIVTKNAYVAAAKLVIEKNATPKDLRMTAEKIAEELLKYRQRLGSETADQ